MGLKLVMIKNKGPSFLPKLRITAVIICIQDYFSTKKLGMHIIQEKYIINFFFLATCLCRLRTGRPIVIYI